MAIAPKHLAVKPLLQLVKSSAQQVNATPEAITWSDNPVDTYDMWASGSPSVINIPITGIYRVTFCGHITTSAATTFYSFWIGLNGTISSEMTGTRSSQSTLGSEGNGFNNIVELTRGDYIEIVANPESDTPRFVSGQYSHSTVEFLGLGS